MVRNDPRVRVTPRSGVLPDVSTDQPAPLAPILWLAGHLGLGSGRTSPAIGDNGMSQPSRTRVRGPAKRRRAVQLETPFPLEERCLLAPYVTLFPTVATFTAATTPTECEPGDGHGDAEHDRDEYLDISPDHFGGRVDTALLVRGRHRAPRGWSGWCIRQRTVRDLAWRRR